MLETQSKKIGGIKYDVQPMSAIQALRLKSRLIKMFGSALGQIIGSGKSIDSEIDGNAISKAIRELLNDLNEDSLIDLFEKFFKNVTYIVKNKNEQQEIFSFFDDFDKSFNYAFQGELMNAYKLLIFIFEVNYPDFFLKIKGAFGNQINKIDI